MCFSIIVVCLSWTFWLICCRLVTFYPMVCIKLYIKPMQRWPISPNWHDVFQRHSDRMQPWSVNKQNRIDLCNRQQKNSLAEVMVPRFSCPAITLPYEGGPGAGWNACDFEGGLRPTAHDDHGHGQFKSDIQQLKECWLISDVLLFSARASESLGWKSTDRGGISHVRTLPSGPPTPITTT